MILIPQILVVLACSRVCGLLLKRIGQPLVIGEMLAGLLLGKSVFALLAPDWFIVLFPEHSMFRLYWLSQAGLIIFMFTVGLDFKFSELNGRASAAVAISHASIALPFALGSLLASAIYSRYAPAGISMPSFVLFMGIAMSITAFPVLARIIQERHLAGTALGTTALTCAAVDDVTAWCLLAAIVGIAQAGTIFSAVGTVIMTLLYVTVMILIRPLLADLLKPRPDEALSLNQFALVVGTVLGSALITETIGIHALFGAFLAGAMMPHHKAIRSGLIKKIETFGSFVLLPIFFAYTGIRLQIGLLNSWESWFICFVIVMTAIAGKVLGSAFAARWSGMPWRDSWAIGVLMNTRGLMELVILNIGYDLGILTPTVFAMMVIMALVTTVMTNSFQKTGATFSMSKQVNKVFLIDLLKTFLIPTLLNKFLMLYFGLNYTEYPGEGYGYGLVATILFLFFTMGRFLWKYRNEEDP